MAKKTVVKKKTSTSKRASSKIASKEIVVHELVPEHKKLSQKEIDELFKYHNITLKELPKILINDAAIRHLDVKENDVIKITRKSPTSGTSVFYRGVINE